MFANFDQVFHDKPQLEAAVPQAVIQYLNRQMPDGMKYRIDVDGKCALDLPDQASMSGFSFELTEEQRKKLGEDCSFDDVLNYFYNMQKPIPLKLEKEGYILINGNEIPIDKMKYHPLEPETYVPGSCCLIPSAFPGPFSLEIGDQTYKRVLRFSRIPHDSISERAFESIQEVPLHMKYFVDDKKNTLRFRISYNLAYAKSIRDIVESLCIFNSFLEGNGYLNQYKLNSNNEQAREKKVKESILKFWKKVLAVEEILEMHFTPSEKELNFETTCLVETLYQNLVHKIPIRSNGKIDTLEGVWKEDKNLKDSIGTTLCFEFFDDTNIELFGQTFKLPGLSCAFNMKLVECVSNNEKYTLAFEDGSQNQLRYTSTLLFKNEEELELYRKEKTERLELFRNAKKVYDYLEKSKR